MAVRLGFLGGRLVTASPEYEDCRRVAARTGRPAKDVYDEARAAGVRRLKAAGPAGQVPLEAAARFDPPISGLVESVTRGVAHPGLAGLTS